MKKFIAFLAIVLIALAAFLVYLVARPYIQMRENEMASIASNNIQGNIIGSAPENTMQTNTDTENVPADPNTVSNETISSANSSQLANVVAEMSAEDLEIYNIAFTVYEGNNVNGQMARALIEGVITSNANHIGVEGRFVAVTQNFDDSVSSTIGVPGNMENSEDVVAECNDTLYTLRDNLDTEALYNIESVQTSGIVTEVRITKVE